MRKPLLSALLPLVLPLALAIQPSAPEANPANLRELKWGRLNFLQTTDTHGWHAGHLQEPQYSADWGDYYSFTVRMRELADKQGVDLLLVDTGDRIEGSGLSDASDPKGKYVREIFSTVDMDVVTIGNHELYKEASSANEYLVMRPHYGERYVVSNVDIYSPVNGALVPLGNRFRKFTTKNTHTRITAFAFLFDFTGNYNNTVVHPVSTVLTEPWFLDAIRPDDTDLFVIIGHTPVRFSPEFPAILAAIREYHPNTPVQFFGGHTHIRDFSVYDDFSTALESGRYCETVGFLSISHIPTSPSDPVPTFSRTYIDFNRFSFQHHSRKPPHKFDTSTGLSLSRNITTYRTALGLDQLLACIPQDYYMFRVPYPHPQSLYSLLSDRILPDMVRSPERKGVPTLVFVNTGSQRFDLLRGEFTTDTLYYVSPFTSKFRVLEGVPFKVARRLIGLFNRSREPWVLSEQGEVVQTTSLPPISPLEQFYHFKQLAAMSEAKQEKEQLENQQPYHHHPHSPQQPLSFKPPNSHNKNNNNNKHSLRSPYREIHHRPFTLAPPSPGYITHDDFGSDGDDTPHTRVKMYTLPNAIVGNHSFPAEGGDDDMKVDVVFLDFIESYILAGLRVLGWRVGRNEGSKPYLVGAGAEGNGEDRTMSELMVEWVGEVWGAREGKC